MLSLDCTRRPVVATAGAALLVSASAAQLPGQAAPDYRWAAGGWEVPAAPESRAVALVPPGRVELTPLTVPALPEAATPVSPESSAAGHPLFTGRDALLAAAFAGATVALFPLDRRIATRLQDPEVQENRFLDDAATDFEVLAVPGAYLAGGATYLVGRFGHHRRVEDIGLHTSEALLLGATLTGVLKLATGRARPFVASDTTPRDFQFGRGLTEGESYTSFPSGHTATAFAAAAALTGETRRWWPRAAWYAGPVLYGGATMVGLSRMYHNKHWASDVALGAAVGTFSGLKVVRYEHAHPGNRIDRWLLAASVAPVRGGAAVAWSVPLR